MLQKLSRYDSLSVVCFAVAMAFGIVYLNGWEGEAEFYQERCGPAVMVALGKGLVNPVDPGATAINDFLEQRTGRIDPEEVPDTIATGPLSTWQACHAYAFYAMGFCWRLFGISWDALHVLQGALFGFLIMAAYFLLRLAMGKPWALGCSLMLLSSPGYLTILPHFRDFSKAPFMMAVFALLGYMLRRPLARRRLFLLAAALGLVMGFGLGFRQDLISCLPPCALLLVCFLPGSLKCTWRNRLLAVVILVMSFVAAGYPILKIMRTETSNSFHFINLGLAAPFNENLGLGDTPYMLAYHYRDEYTHAAIASYGMRAKGLSHVTAYPSIEYDRMGAAYFSGQFVRNFPGDFVARWYVAASRVLGLSPFALDASYPLELKEDLLNRIFYLRWRCLGWLCGWGAWLALAALTLISARSLRLALASGFALLYFSGYVSLQFMLRHYFHLEVFFWCVLGFLAAQGCAALLRLLRRHQRHLLWESCVRSRPWRSPEAVRALLFLGAAACTVLVPFAVARGYQYWRVGKIYQQYRSLNLEPLDVQTVAEGHVSFNPKDFLAPEEGGEAQSAPDLRTGLLAVEVAAAESPFPVVFAYRAPEPRNDFTMWSIVEPAQRDATGNVKLFCPVYTGGVGSPYERRFEGVRVPEAFARNVKGLYRVSDLQAVPVLLHLTLPEDWPALPRYLTSQWYRVPALVRAHWSRGRDILGNGDFEAWDDATHAPVDILAPSQYSRITRETEQIAHGASALRQTWLLPDSQAPLLERCCVAVDGVKAGATYELFFSADNCSQSTFVISAWQVITPPAGQAELRMLKPEVAVVPPKKGFHSYHGVFYVARTTSPFTLVLATSARDTVTNGDTVIWDDWRLIEITDD